MPREWLLLEGDGFQGRMGRRLSTIYDVRNCAGHSALVSFNTNNSEKLAWSLPFYG